MTEHREEDQRDSLGADTVETITGLIDVEEQVDTGTSVRTVWWKRIVAVVLSIALCVSLVLELYRVVRNPSLLSEQQEDENE